MKFGSWMCNYTHDTTSFNECLQTGIFVKSWQSFRKSLVGSCSPKCRFTLSQCVRLPALVSVGVSAHCPKHYSLLSWIVIYVRSLTRNKLGTKNRCTQENYYFRRMIFDDSTPHIMSRYYIFWLALVSHSWQMSSKQMSKLNWKMEM